ncbi:SDR family oxidoreductase, partial [bacterium]
MQKPRRVLVTGATGTLGSALVAALTNEGCEVVGNYCHDEARALRLQSKTGCHLERGDVSQEAVVESLFSQPFEAVFHLAGYSRDALLPRVSHQEWQDHLKVNLQSAFLVTRASLTCLPRGGKLVLVSSRVGERGFSGQSAYGASKAALLGLMKTAAIEGRPSGIAVNAICPGFAPSEMSKSLSPEILTARSRENWLPE